MKTKTVASILKYLVMWVPIIVYGCFNIESFYSTADKGITISAIVVIGAVLFFMKDKFINWIKSPSAFKYVAILWIMSLIFVVLGNSIFEITSILLASFLAAIPFDVWRQHLDKDAVDDDTLKKLKELLNK